MDLIETPLEEEKSGAEEEKESDAEEDDDLDSFENVDFCSNEQILGSQLDIQS